MSGTGVANCPELDIDLPTNDASTCWWLATNFALFHKKRAELDRYFDAENTSEDADRRKQDKLNIKLKKSFFEIYKHYTGVEKITQEKIIELRTEEGMGDAFNVEGGDGNLLFDVKGSNNQSADEYIVQLLRYIPFTGKIEPLVIKGSNNDYYGQMYDIFIHQLYVGTPNVDNTQRRLRYSQITSTTDTVIIDFKRLHNGSFIQDKIIILKEITIPLINPVHRVQDEKNVWERYIRDEHKKGFTDTQINDIIKKQNYNDLVIIPIKTKETLQKHADFVTFKLDAVVEATGSHFNSYINCSNTDTWAFYNAMSAGTLRDNNIVPIPFDEMIERGVEKRAILLFYTREKTVASLPAPPGGLPEPLPAPPAAP